MVYKQMCSLKIRSRMTKRINKPKTHTEYNQRPNLIKNVIKKLSSGELILFIIEEYPGHWVYLSSIYNESNHKIIAYKVSKHMTSDLVKDRI